MGEKEAQNSTQNAENDQKNGVEDDDKWVQVNDEEAQEKAKVDLMGASRVNDDSYTKVLYEEQ